MTTFIALLRGINVGGHRVKMERLRGLFSELGLADVRSFIQSGNIFFNTGEADETALASRIEAHLEAALGFSVPVFLRTVVELEGALHPNPFEGVEATPDTRLLIVFSKDPLGCELPLRSPDGNIEILSTTRGELFLVYCLTNGKPPDVSTWLKRTFGPKANATTTRFYDTTLKMLREVQTLTGSDSPENSINTLQTFLADATQKAASQLEAALMRLPEDKRSWSAGGDARSALDMVAECAIINGSAAETIERRAFPATSAYDTYSRDKADLCANWPALKTLLDENTSRIVEVIRALSDEELKVEVQMPWGAMTLAQLASYSYWNMSYHEGQINFIASLLSCLAHEA